MKRKLLIRDLTLRDGQQSQLATRMNQSQIDRTLPFYKEANFYAMEVWGGAVLDSAMRFLNEDPWERLAKIKEQIGGVSKLTALSRGRNLFGYNPYPETVIEGFNRVAIETGIDIMRIFDALNDTDNMISTINAVRKNGGEVDCAVCYTVDPKFSVMDRVKSVFNGNKIPPKLFSVDYFVGKAVKLEKLGADIISIKDMAGLVDPKSSYELVSALKKNVKTPIDMHTHCTPGYGLASVLMSIMAGVDIVDAVILNFSSGPAAPSIELLQIFCDKLGIDTGLNFEAISKINNELLSIRKELSNFDKVKKIPIKFDYNKDKLPREIEILFDSALKAADDKKYEQLISNIHKIESSFNLPAPNIAVKDAEIPGGMYTNMVAQLEQMNVPHLFNDVLKQIPSVRRDAGLTPLVTPTSQIVGAQAVTSVINESKGKPFYSQISKQFKNLIMGQYGTTPYPIDPSFREMVTGNKAEIAYDVSKYQQPPNDEIAELPGVKLAENEKEQLLLGLFPDVAKVFLKDKKIKEAVADQAINQNKNYADLVNALRENYLD